MFVALVLIPIYKIVHGNQNHTYHRKYTEFLYNKNNKNEIFLKNPQNKYNKEEKPAYVQEVKSFFWYLTYSGIARNKTE